MSGSEDEARAEREYAAAQEVAREIVTTIKMVEDRDDDDALVASFVRGAMRDFTPRQSAQLVEVLAWAVAGAFDGGLADWSEHIVRALAEEES